MSDDKGKKNKKSKDDEVKYFSSSESSVTSLSTQAMSLDSASTPADLRNVHFSFDSPLAERSSQEQSSEAQASSSQTSPKPLTYGEFSSVKSPRKQLQSSPPTKGAFKDGPVSPQKQQSRSPSMGASHEQSKTFPPIAEEERCLLDSESSESSIERLPETPQRKTELVDVNLEEKRRSTSLPTDVLPEVQQVSSSDESKKRTKSEGQIKPSGKGGENPTPKKKSPLKKALEKCGKVLGFMKVHDKQVKKDGAETHTVVESIPELSEDSGDGKERAKNPELSVSGASGPSAEQGVAEAAAQNVEPMEEELEQRNDPDSDTPRRSRRLARLDDKSYGGSPSKRRDLKE